MLAHPNAGQHIHIHALDSVLIFGRSEFCFTHLGCEVLLALKKKTSFTMQIGLGCGLRQNGYAAFLFLLEDFFRGFDRFSNKRDGPYLHWHWAVKKYISEV